MLANKVKLCVGNLANREYQKYEFGDMQMEEQNELKNRKILIGVSSGIAIYKTCSLARLFLKHGATVKVIMTENAIKLVSPLTFQSLTRSAVYVSMWDPIDTDKIQHIHLAEWADMLVLAPATANTLAKMVNGMADNLLTTTILALPEETPIIVVPAMNDNMWKNVFVQENIHRLRKRRDCYIVKPVKGMLATGKIGEGKMANISKIFETAKEILLDKKETEKENQ
jgi:phosphopantothenoylcysteine decarboxylase/phosphopantothenate--cysteine ligase